MDLSPREKKIAIGLGGLIGAYVFYTLVLEPFVDRIDAASARLNAAQLALVDANAAQSNVRNERERWAKIAGKSLLTNDSEAQGQLLNKVTSYVQDAGLATPGSIRPERTAKEQDFQRITVRATLGGTMAQLSRFLFSLKYADIPLRVNEITIAPNKEGTDDLAMTIQVSTIYVPPRADGTTPGGTSNAAGAASAVPGATGGR